MKRIITAVVLSFACCTTPASAGASLKAWVTGQSFFRCFPYALTVDKIPPQALNLFPSDKPVGMTESLNALQTQMSGHTEGASETGTWAIYDPVHRIGAGWIGYGEDSSVNVLFTEATTPPRSIAWRDLSHFNPGDHRVIGLTLGDLRKRYGAKHVVSRCGLQAVSYEPNLHGHPYGYQSTFILRNGRVAAFTEASP